MFCVWLKIDKWHNLIDIVEDAWVIAAMTLMK